MILVDGTNPTIASVQCFILALATLDRISSGTFAFALEGRKNVPQKISKVSFPQKGDINGKLLWPPFSIAVLLPNKSSSVLTRVSDINSVVSVETLGWHDNLYSCIARDNVNKSLDLWVL